MIESFLGRSVYLPDHLADGAPVFVAVRCRIGDAKQPIPVMLVTGAHWCLIPPEMAARLGFELTPNPFEPRLSTRYGLMEGRLERIPVEFPADDGENLQLEATCFLTADWRGPAVIGWKGCLERMRFSLDPGQNLFSFAPL